MTVTGNPAEFTVNGVAATVNSLTVPFSPIQDLNGYDSPWPAGGGANIWGGLVMANDIATATGVTIDQQAKTVGVTISGEEAKLTGDLQFKENTQYTFILNGSGSQTANLMFTYTDGTTDRTLGRYLQIGANVSAPGKTVASLYKRNYDGTTVINYEQSGLFEGIISADQFSPYENICPISGRTGLSVYRTGVNVWDGSIVTGKRINSSTGNADNASSYSCSDFIEVLPNTAYYFKDVCGNTYCSGCWYDSDKQGIIAFSLGNGSKVSGTATAPDTARYVRFNVYNNQGYGETCINYPSTDHDYHAYNGNTYAVDWTSEAGTVYGGTLDVVTGLLTVNMGNIPSYNGETINEPWLSSMDAYAAGTTPTTGAQVVYKLATPLTYQLTAQTINLLAGITNYVWSDTNEDITISFDVAAYIRHLFRVNGVDFSRFVERDSYATALEPVYAETIQTMDGVNHTALLRTRGSIRLRFNPQTDSDTAAICSALLAAPCEVQYRCLQRDVDVTALMCVDTISAQFLSRCLYLGDEWNQIESITLTEL